MFNVMLNNIKNKDRMRYYEALREAQKGNLRLFVTLVIKYLKEVISVFD